MGVKTLIAVGISASLWPAAGAGASSRCLIGKTLFKAGSVRVFDVTRTYRHSGFDPSPYEVIYACAAGRRWRIDQSDPYTDYRFYGIRRISSRLGFITHLEGHAGGSSTSVGWTDIKIHRTRIGLINAGEDHEPGDPMVPDDRVTYAIAADGVMAVLGGRPTSSQQVALLERRGRRFFKRTRVLFNSKSGGFVHGSLAISADEVSWDASDGRRFSIARP